MKTVVEIVKLLANFVFDAETEPLVAHKLHQQAWMPGQGFWNPFGNDWALIGIFKSEETTWPLVYS